MHIKQFTKSSVAAETSSSGYLAAMLCMLTSTKASRPDMRGEPSPPVIKPFWDSRQIDQHAHNSPLVMPPECGALNTVRRFKHIFHSFPTTNHSLCTFSCTFFSRVLLLLSFTNEPSTTMAKAPRVNSELPQNKSTQSYLVKLSLLPCLHPFAPIAKQKIL